ncbi:unnamed protein product [Sphagnum troendelagicum]
MNGDHSSQRPVSAAARMYDRSKGDHGGVRQSRTSRFFSAGSSALKFGRGRRPGGHTSRNLPCSTGLLLVLCLLVVLVTIYSSEVISFALKGEQGSSQLDGFFNKLDITHSELNGRRQDKRLSPQQIQGVGTDSDPMHLSMGEGRDQVELVLDKVEDLAGKSNRSNSEEQRNPDPTNTEQSASLYNERERTELVEYAAQLEQEEKPKQEEMIENQGATSKQANALHQDDNDDYDDDGGEVEPEEHDTGKSDQGDASEGLHSDDSESRLDGSSHALEGDGNTRPGGAITKKDNESMIGFDLGETTSSSQEQQRRDNNIEQIDTQLAIVQKPLKSKKKCRHKTKAAPCAVDFKNTTEGLEEPKDYSNFAEFSLSYIQMEDKPAEIFDWEPRFAGHQTLEERKETFHVRDQMVHCGFVQAPEGYPLTGFEFSDLDAEFLQTCHIAVSSCIFGNWDRLRFPTNKKMSDYSKKNICFVMFVDQESLDVILQEEEPKPNAKGDLGLWRIVLIKNLPYLDGRRNGKVPKFLTHRIFPNARYSIWLDSKLRLDSDPLLILEYFLWRGKHEYAISNHYDRHCVWEEVEQNKCLNKFNHTIIDQQFQFYQEDGLTQFNESDPHRLLPSYVPEGSFIVRAHTPMANLFSCLWFNEVDRFTPRDQLSFAYTYLKLVRTNPSLQFHLNMFKDCERKAITKLYHHRKG